jgi:multidrug efflux system membrane fusion protein
VNIRLMLDVRKNATVIPAAAVQTGAQGPYVYTVKNNTAEMHNVKVDVTQGNVTLIASGVVPGDQVVVDGQDKLQAGTTVVPHSGSDNPSDAGAPAAGDAQGAGKGSGRGFKNGGGNGTGDGSGPHNGAGRGPGNRGPKGPTT